MNKVIGNPVERSGFQFSFKLCAICFSLLLVFILAVAVISVVSIEKTNARLIDNLREEQLLALEAHERAYTLLLHDLQDTIVRLDGESQEEIQASFSKVTTGIRKVDAVYSGLLAEQKKKTLDSVYSETDISAKYKEAIGFLDKKKFRQANELFSFVVTEQPDNLEARYYRIYSLFNMNTMDRNQYGLIQKELLLLEKSGFENPEIENILAFIESETASKLNGRE